MKNFVRVIPFVLLTLLLPVLLSCGGGSAARNPNGSDPPISVAIADRYVVLGAGEAHQFTATVTGSSNTKVTWNLSGCTGDICGTISATGLYTAPAVIPIEATVTVTATTEADPAKADSAAVEQMPIAVSISPAGAWVAPGGTTDFTASVHYDPQHAGVIWALGPLCSDNCGTLSDVAPPSVTYAAPAAAPDPHKITLTATSVTDSSKKAEITINVSTAGGLTQGDYAFVFNGWETPITNGYYWMYGLVAAGRFHADGNGNIIDGVEDINSRSGVSKAVPFTGTYLIGSDNRGSFTITTDQGTATYHMVVDPSKGRGEFIRYDALDPDNPIFGTGYFELQDRAAFSLTALAGPYAFGISGAQDANRLATVGRFSADAAGDLTSGHIDLTKQVHVGADRQASSTDLELTGSLGAPSPNTGRGTATLTWGSSFKFAYYIISDQKILLVQTDTRSSTTPVLSGEVRRQIGPFSAASFSAPAIFSMAGVNRSTYADFYVNAAIGQIVPDGSGSVTGIVDDNQGLSNQSFTGSYTVDSGGRSTLVLEHGSGSTNTHIAYFVNQNEAFLLQTSGTDVLFGRLKPQTTGPYSEASITGTFLTHTEAPASEQAENDCGLTTFNGVGGITSAIDVNIFGDPGHFDIDGTYSVAPNGRGTLSFSPPSSGSVVFWIASPTEVVGIGAVSPFSDWTQALLQFER
jgi:hypothetical protein